MAKLPATLESERGHGVAVGWAPGYPWDPSEPSRELQWPESVFVYDRMRRQDAQVGSIMRAVTLPLRRTQWRLDPNGARDEVVAHVKGDIGLGLITDKSPEPSGARVRGRFSWDEHLRHALLALAYGHMPFEQTYDIRDGRAHLAHLSPRLPTTIGKIRVNRAGELEGISQYPSGIPGDVQGPLTDIDLRGPNGYLAYYCIDREAGIWQGQSMLRQAYKHWLLKDKLLRVHAMSMERIGGGLIWAEGAPGMTQTQLADLNQMAQKARTGESSGAALPSGARLHLAGIEGTAPNILDGVRYHDEQIAGMVLAQFLELGRTAHGSRSLGASFIDFFILALQALADEIATTATSDIVETLVDLNWGPDEIAPKVTVAEISEEHQLTAQAIGQLLTTGAITNDDGLEDYIREMYRLPIRTGPARPLGTGSAPIDSSANLAASRGKVRAAQAAAMTAKTWVGWTYDRKVTNHYTPEFAAAFRGLIDARALAADAKTIEGDPATVARILVADLHPDNAAALEVLKALYGDAYIAGKHAAEVSIAKARKVAAAIAVEDPWDAGIDWSRWKPGFLKVADLLDQTGGLDSLLSDAGVEIAGMTATMLDRIGSALADGLTNGDSIDMITDALTEILGDEDRAAMIAQTETARALTVASLDSYAENGVAAKEFLTAGDELVDDECAENEDAGAVGLDEDFPNGDPPVHPGCRCCVLPVLDGEGEGEGEGDPIVEGD